LSVTIPWMNAQFLTYVYLFCVFFIWTYNLFPFYASLCVIVFPSLCSESVLWMSV
jgi:hypothetical protein